MKRTLSSIIDSAFWGVLSSSIIILAAVLLVLVIEAVFKPGPCEVVEYGLDFSFREHWPTLWFEYGLDNGKREIGRVVYMEGLKSWVAVDVPMRHTNTNCADEYWATMTGITNILAGQPSGSNLIDPEFAAYLNGVLRLQGKE